MTGSTETVRIRPWRSTPLPKSRRPFSFPFARVFSVGFAVATVLFLSITHALAQRTDLTRLSRQYEALYKAGNYNKALATARKFAFAVKRRLGPRHSDYGLSLRLVGDALAATGRTAEARSFYHRALKADEKAPGGARIEAAEVLSKLADIEERDGQFANAALLYERALKIRESRQGPTHVDIAAALNNVANIYEKLGRNDEAESRYLRALEVEERALGPRHVTVAAILSNLANTYSARGQLDKAEPLYRRALSIREVELDAEDEGIAQSAQSLGEISQSKERYDEAGSLYQRALAIKEKNLGNNHNEVATLLNNLGNVKHSLGRYVEAENLFKRALRIKINQVGPNHPDTGTVNNNLAHTILARGRSDEAEIIYRQALRILESSLGSTHPRVAQTLNNLANLYRSKRRFEDAEALYKRAMLIRETAVGLNHSDTLESLDGLASIYREQNKYDRIDDLYKSALQRREHAFGLDHPALLDALRNLGGSASWQGRSKEAEQYYARALSIQEKAGQEDNLLTADILHGFAGALRGQARNSEAKGLFERALAIREKRLGPEDPIVAESINDLAVMYEERSEYREAEQLHERALAIRKMAFGLDHWATAQSLNNLAIVNYRQHKMIDAEQGFRQALEIREKIFGPDHVTVGDTLVVLASLVGDQRRYAEAEMLYQRALKIRESLFESEHTSTMSVVHDLGNLARWQGHYDKAERLYARATEFYERKLGVNHPDVAKAYNNLALLEAARDNVGGLIAYSRKASAAVLHQTASEGLTLRRRGESDDVIDAHSTYLKTHLVALALGAAAKLEAQDVLAQEAFRIAQWASKSEAGKAVSQMATRSASDTALAALIRQTQVLTGQRRAQDRAVVAAVAGASGAEIERLQQATSHSDAKIESIAARIERDFPDFSALANPVPLGTDQVRMMLDPDEALTLVKIVSDKMSFVFTFTRERFVWHVIGGDEQLTSLVSRLPSYSNLSRAARALANEDKSVAGDPSESSDAFDLVAAHELYRTLFGPIEEMIKDKKRLIVVADGVLTGLPFQLLVKEAPEAGTTFKTAHWLIRDHAISVLPAVSSLRALRGIPRKPRTSSLPFIGFGDPLIGGGGVSSCAGYEQDDPGDKPIALAGQPRAPAIDVQMFSGGGFTEEGIAIADVEWLRGQERLADSRCEVETLARLGGPGSAMYVGAQATETTVKELSAKGELKKYRVLAFATHGLLPEQAKGVSEAGLILTPPVKGSAQDDGLLTASEVAGLDLDADWAILSACNTASGDKPGAATLSGLARAFFYAGARSLLVSHWPVDSRAAVLLTTRTLRAIEQDASIGKAEALRQAMLSFLADDVPDAWSNPRIWAPFSLVGEGAR